MYEIMLCRMIWLWNKNFGNDKSSLVARFKVNRWLEIMYAEKIMRQI